MKFDLREPFSGAAQIGFKWRAADGRITTERQRLLQAGLQLVLTFSCKRESDGKLGVALYRRALA